jgi:hypothetical protein
VTNEHVIRGEHNLRIRLRTGEERPVFAVIRQDEARDLAILSVDPTGLAEAVLGDSESVQPGEEAIAVGSPLGLEYTVTKGIISQIRKASSGVTLLQTQVPVSQGNSGCPLFNARGEVVGIITMQVRPALAQNLNFAVAVNELRAMLGVNVSHRPSIPQGPYIDRRSEPPSPPPAPRPTGYALHLTDGQTVLADSVEEADGLIIVKRPGVSFSYPKTSVSQIVNREDGTSRAIGATPSVSRPAQQAQQARVDPASPSTPTEAQRTRPSIRIRLKNGSEIAADRAWFQDEWLFYERSGFQDKVRIANIDVLTDEELEARVGACLGRFREAEVRIGATAEAARQLRKDSFSPYERALINETASRIIAMEEWEARRVCDQALAKWAANKRQLEEALKGARK